MGDLRKDDLFVLSWARVRQVRRVSVASELLMCGGGVRIILWLDAYLGVVKYGVYLCRTCDGCDRWCVFCLNCETWSCRCSCIGSMSVMQMLYVCVLCASCGSHLCCILHDLQFDAGRGCKM